MTITQSIVSQHAEEAAFQWLLRDAAVRAPHYGLADLAKLDHRVDAHLDGLRIAGDAGWDLCKAQLVLGEPGEVFAAAVVALESGDQARVQEVLEVGVSSPEAARGLISALGWLPYRQVEAYIGELIAAASAHPRRIGIAACAVHRHDPGRALVQALADTDPLVRARALRAVGELGRADLLPLLREHLTEEKDQCRFSAAWSAALLGENEAVAALRSLVRSNSPWREKALDIALRRMNPHSGRAWQQELRRDPEQARPAVIAAGVLGEPDAIPWLIEQIRTPELARVAGGAFTMITGVDIAYEDLETKRPEGFEAGPTENPEDENVAMDPDENLPWPDPELIQKWCAKNQGRFRKGTRHLLGKPITDDWCQQVLRNGKQRQRAAAALELAILHPGKPLFNVAAPGFRQQELLGLKKTPAA